VQEPGLFEIILKVSDWHVASNCSKNVSSNLRSSTDAQIEQQDLKPQHDQRMDRKIEPCHDTMPEPNLYFSTDVRDAISVADMIFITVNTPSKVNSPLSLWSQLSISILT
jgi:UDP-glucose 6-dehydrogenase